MGERIRSEIALWAGMALAFAMLPAAAGASSHPPHKIDRDGNKVFDDLDRRLEGLGAGDRVRVIVRLREQASATRIGRVESGVGRLSVRRRLPIVRGFAGTASKRQVARLARRADVAAVEEDSRVRAFNNEAQEAFGLAKARLDAPSLDGDADGAPATYSKDDLVAAVIDTGVDPGHLDLDGGKTIAFHDWVNGQSVAYDDHGHGTHVAATIAGDGEGRSDGLYRGAAPRAAVVGLKVLNSAGSGYMSDVAAAIDWSVQNKSTYGIDAINLSLGTSGCSSGGDSASLAVDAAVDAGIVVAVAAGNAGPGTCTIGSPGAARKALTVAAMSDFGASGFRLAYFSSRGYTADGRLKPDVSAPGVNVTSAQANTASGYVTWSGTSMATPFAAGVALLMREAGPSLTAQQVKDKLMQTAVDWGRGSDSQTAGSSGHDIEYGAGRLDAYAAIASAGAAISDPPPMPAHGLFEGTLSGTGQYTDYPIEVTGTSFPIAATMVQPGISGASAQSPDFDLYLYSPGGVEVARAYTTSRQEDLGHQPSVTGTYTLRVHSYEGSGAYFVDVSAGAGEGSLPALPVSGELPGDDTQLPLPNADTDLGLGGGGDTGLPGLDPGAGGGIGSGFPSGERALTLSGERVQQTALRRGSLSVRAECSAPCLALARAWVYLPRPAKGKAARSARSAGSAGKRFRRVRVKLVQRSLRAGRPATLRVPLDAVLRRRVRQALRGQTSVRARVQVTVVDREGTVRRTWRTLRIRR